MARDALPLLIVALSSTAFCLDNGVGRTPALGWSTWNYFETKINQTLVQEMADAMVSTGLRDAGYSYLNLDAGVWSPTRTNGTGELQPDPLKFPDGIKALADRLHAQGLKLGLYINLGPDTGTCGRIGSMGNYEKDAKTLAGWGMDYLKVDYCAYNPLKTGDKPWTPPIATQLSAWQDLRDALNKTGRPIWFNACPRSFEGSLVAPDPKAEDCKPVTPGCDTPGCPRQRCIVDGPPHEWNGETRSALANSILTERSNSHDGWGSAMSNLDALLELRPEPDVGGPGFFSDGDMLHSCNFGGGAVGHDPQGMKPGEYQAQFAVWAVMASPIIISADLRSLQRAHPDCLAMLKNKEVLAVHQDLAAQAPTIIFKNRTAIDAVTGAVVTAQGFSRMMHDGSVALALLNREDRGRIDLAVKWEDVGLPASTTCNVRDIINQQDLPKATGSYSSSVNAHTTNFVRIGSCVPTF